MNKEQYPERIYCDATWIEHTADGQLATCDGNFNSIKQKREDVDNVEYIRADLFKWHMADEEMPPIVIEGRFSETVLVVTTDGFYGTAYLCKYANGTCDWCSTDTNISTDGIVVWKFILEYSHIKNR